MPLKRGNFFAPFCYIFHIVKISDFNKLLEFRKRKKPSAMGKGGKEIGL
jgi:hypothetical protein